MRQIKKFFNDALDMFFNGHCGIIHMVLRNLPMGINSRLLHVMRGLNHCTPHLASRQYYTLGVKRTNPTLPAVFPEWRRCLHETACYCHPWSWRLSEHPSPRRAVSVILSSSPAALVASFLSHPSRSTKLGHRIF